MEPAQRPGSTDEPANLSIDALAFRQHGLVARNQALAVGLSPSAIARRLTTSAWIRVLPTVYRVAAVPASSRQSALAACLWAGPAAVVSHATAGVLWQLDGIATSAIHVTVPASAGRRHASVVVHRTLAMPAADATSFHGVPITSPARTLIDVAGELDDEQLVAAYSSGLRTRAFTRSFLTWRLDQIGGRGRPGSQRLRDLIAADTDAPMESRLEVKVWRLVRQSGLPAPRRQHIVAVEGHRFRLDFAWPERRVAVEAEGRAAHDAHRFYGDRSRLGDLVAHGWRVVPVTWRDVTTEPDVWLRKLARTLVLAA